MYHIPHLLSEDPDAGILINYGKSIVEAFPLSEASDEDKDRLHRCGNKMTSQFISNCEDIGLDHRDDNLRTDYILYQATRVNNKIAFVMAITILAKANIEPCNFDNPDHFHYILGRVGIGRITELLGEILDLEAQR